MQRDKVSREVVFLSDTFDMCFVSGGSHISCCAHVFSLRHSRLINRDGAFHHKFTDFSLWVNCSDSLAFAVEPIFASLANVLGNHERLPASIPSEIKVSEL